ncbi:MAG TPA: APC family permease [Actinomycetes bacterium]|nr:APC family permease [Actinomycetes bacterium]
MAAVILEPAATGRNVLREAVRRRARARHTGWTSARCGVMEAALATNLKPELKQVPPVPRESRRYQSPLYRAKRVLLGAPLKTSQLINERISKRVALAVFSSDPISSTAYATEEILIVLVTAAAIGFTLPVSLGIAALLLLLVISYRQVIETYPSAGGAYVVSRDNFGNLVASVAGAALLVDYVLTVAVSVSSGVAAMVSVYGWLQPYVVWISVGFVVLLAWGNLRGIREAGRIFAVPTYVYVVSVGAMVVVGIWRVAAGGLSPIGYSPAEQAELHGAGQAVGAVTLFLILRAFASGTTALTGVEAISNGVSAFRRPEAHNAKRTLLAMAFIMGSLFVGISYLAGHLGIHPFESGFPTVLSQLSRYVLAADSSAVGHAAFLLLQAATLLILVLAANTSFSGFPLLASFAAEDALLPRQLRKRGHRLVYSNGIIVLSAIAIVLIIGFRARVSALIPLYAIGVVTSFTLAQLGMTRRHLKHRERGWRAGLAVNGVGGLVTFVVLLVIIVAKFNQGAWMVVVAIPVIVLLLLRTQSAYRSEVAELKVEASQRLAPPKPRHEVVVLVEDLDRATLGGLQYARQLNPLSITAVHVAVDPDHARELAQLWAKVHIPIPLEVVDCPDRNLLATVEETIAELVRPDTEVTVLIPKRGYSKFWHRLLHDRTALGVFKVLGEMDNVNVTIVPFRLGNGPTLASVSHEDLRGHVQAGGA